MSESRPSILAVLEKSLARARARGPRELLQTALGRLKQEISSDDELIFLTRPAGGPLSRRDGLEVGRATPADAGLYARDIGTDSGSTFSERLTEATMCFLVLGEGRAVHASWVATSAAWTLEIRRFVTPPARAAYVYESFTRPDARGRGVYPFALEGIAHSLSQDGIEEIWVAVERDNVPSQRAIAKAGFVPAFELRYRRRFGRLTIENPTGPRASEAEALFSRSSL